MKASVLLFLGLFGLANARAQSAIDWFTIDAGGILASSTNYLVNNTLGQAEAGVSSSANYQIVGGFWALVPPSLSVAVTVTV